MIYKIEYDPFRTAFLAMVIAANGVAFHIMASRGLKEGMVISAGAYVKLIPGNASLLRYIPHGTQIHHVELTAGAGAQYVRAAGAYAKLVTAMGRGVVIRLRSGKFIRVVNDAQAVIGAVSNFKHHLRVFRKAGYYVNKGFRPVVRGVAMNPVDHPHGGGEGKSSGGRPSVSGSGRLSKSKKKLRIKIYTYEISF